MHGMFSPRLLARGVGPEEPAYPQNPRLSSGEAPSGGTECACNPVSKNTPFEPLP